MAQALVPTSASIPVTMMLSRRIERLATIAVWGAPKTGKSYLALSLSHLLLGEDKVGNGESQIGVISSEYGGQSHLAEKFPHTLAQLDVDPDGDPIPDAFAVERYLSALSSFEQRGYRVVVIDSGSHLWEGDGGLLDRLEYINRERKKTEKDFSAWGEVSPLYWEFVRSLKQSPCHVITTLRCKEQYEVAMVNGRATPRNVGQGPIMRGTFANEMHTILQVRDDHSVYIEGTYAEELLTAFPDRAVGTAQMKKFITLLRDSFKGDPWHAMTPMEAALRPYKLKNMAKCQATPAWKEMIVRQILKWPKEKPLPKWAEFTEEQVSQVSSVISGKVSEPGEQGAA